MMTDENACPSLSDSDRAREGAAVLWRLLALHSKSPEFAGANVAGLPAAERRTLDLSGRYQVGDGNEFACEVPEISPLGLRLKGPKIGRVGDWCLANIGSVGIIEGVVMQANQYSFVAGVIATPRRLRRLAERLTWQLRHTVEEVPERRVHERVEMNEVDASLETATGEVYPCRIFDMSEGGAALHLGSGALYFWPDQPLKFDGRPARVLRTFPGGVVIKYD